MMQNKVHPAWLGAQTLPQGFSDTAWVQTEQRTLETGVHTDLGRRLSLLISVVRAGLSADSPGFGSGYLLELLHVRVLNQNISGGIEPLPTL